MEEPEAGIGESQRPPSRRFASPASVTRGFLFSDLRDYTRYVEAHGAVDAADLLERYRATVRKAVAEHDGAEIKTEGDSFYVVFPAVSAAVLCGLAIVDAAGGTGADATARPDQGRYRDPCRRDGRDGRRLCRIAGQHRGPDLRRSPGRAKSSSAIPFGP